MLFMHFQFDANSKKNCGLKIHENMNVTSELFSAYCRKDVQWGQLLADQLNMFLEVRGGLFSRPSRHLRHLSWLLDVHSSLHGLLASGAAGCHSPQNCPKILPKYAHNKKKNGSAPEDLEGLRSQKNLIFQNAQIKVLENKFKFFAIN